MNRFNEFPLSIKQQALSRQKFKCGSCGTPISMLGIAGASTHAYGESADAHHIIHIKLGGSNGLKNCVILCKSCHYSAHEGGSYSNSIIVGQVKDFDYYSG